MKKWLTSGVMLLILVIAATGCASTETSSSGSSDAKSADAGTKSTSAASCGRKATDDCTPRIGWKDGYVRVDAVLWNVTSVDTKKTIGDMTYGLGEKADGMFVVAKLKARSKKDESATLTDNAIKLQIGNTTYDPDSEGTVAAMGSGQKPFFLRDLGPDSTTTGTVVFDVPTSKLGKKMELRFGELGFGETHAFVRLPSLAA